MTNDPFLFTCPIHTFTISLTFSSLPHLQSVIKGLLDKVPDNRLGGGPRDGKDVMAHPFFASIDFAKLLKREIKPQFVPVVTSGVLHDQCLCESIAS